MMTRYEFATLIYKAVKKLNVNEKPIHEFEAELECDVIAKDKDGNPTIERIRVN